MIENTANQIIVVTTNQNGRLSKCNGIYLPVYLQFIIKNFKSFDFEKLSAEVNMQFQIAIKIEGLPEDLKKFLTKNLRMFFSKNEGIKLHDSVDNKEVTADVSDKKYLYFTIRKLMNAQMIPYLVFSPFELIDLFFRIQLRKSSWKFDGGSIEIKLFLVEPDTEKIDVFKCLKQTDSSFGNYQLAKNKVHIQYSTNSNFHTLIQSKMNIYNSELNDLHQRQIKYSKLLQEKQKKQANKSSSLQDQDNDKNRKNENKDKKKSIPKDYPQYCHIHMPIYRGPMVILFTVFAPTWILTIINLAVFFTSPGLGDRVSTLAVLMIAFVAVVPGIREKLPSYPTLTIIEVLVYLEQLTVILCLINSLRVRKQDKKQFKQNFDAYSTPEYLISLIILLFHIVISVIGIIVHYCCLERTYVNFKPKLNWQSEKFEQWHCPDQNGKGATMKWLNGLQENTSQDIKLIYDPEVNEFQELINEIKELKNKKNKS